MFFNKDKQYKKEIDSLFFELKINLQNNYKDLAIGARKRLEEKLQEYYSLGYIKDKNYCKYKKDLDEYTKKMEGYHH